MTDTKQATTEAPPVVACLEISVGINPDTWRQLESNHMSNTEIENHLITDIKCAISRYDGYHNLLDGGVPDISLTKYY